MFFVLPLVILSVLTLYSSESVRFYLMEYYLNTEDYTSAIEMGTKIINKRKVTGSLNKEFIKRMGESIEIAYTQKIVQEMAFAQKEWENSRNFFKTNQIILDRIIPFLENQRTLLEPFLQKESNIWNQTYKLLSSMKPYAAETGYLENDFKPESGALTFGYSGGWALDYNLRSIGANLGSKKSVVAIRLRRVAEKTRVKPDNLSIWISNDSKLPRSRAAGH